MAKLVNCPFCRVKLPDHHKSCNFAKPAARKGNFLPTTENSIRSRNIVVNQKPHSIKRVK